MRLELGERSYDIIVGSGLLAEAGKHLSPLLKSSRVVIVTDDNVAPLYLSALERSIKQAGFEPTSVALPAGEASKNYKRLEFLTETILAAGIDRATTLVALGGGVIGDITGFTAGILLRGLDYVQIPTTLLAQVDSSVGGKTGINTRIGKNLVGLFHQPRLVMADIDVLDTLDERQLRAGYAEVVKYGLINDPAFFSWLEANGTALGEGNRAVRTRAVITSCAAKADIVAADERRSGRRALLNLGHTFGHALEAASGFGDTLLHGEGVAIGMVMAFELSCRLGLCPQKDTDRVRSHLRAMNLPTDLADVHGQRWSADELVRLMGHDKKMKSGRVNFVLTRGIGAAFISVDDVIDQVREMIDAALTP